MTTTDALATLDDWSLAILADDSYAPLVDLVHPLRRHYAEVN